MNRDEIRQRRLRRRHLIVMMIMAIIVVILIGLIFVNLNHSHQQRVRSLNKTRQSSVQKVTSRKTITHPDSVLTALMGKATEDSDTQTNGEATYSQFYRQGNQWYWKLTSNGRGVIEIGEISHISKEKSSYQFTTKSQVYEPGTTYQLAFHWLNKQQQQYNLHTDFKHINGDYTIGVQPQTVDTRHLTRTQVKEWIVRNINKYTDSPSAVHKTMNTNYYGFQFSFDKQGRLGIFVTENHDYDNKMGADVDPHVAPTVGSFTITTQGYLKVDNIGTSGMDMVKAVTGSNSAQSAIVARSFDE
ncbi:hypothetical protein OF387_01570 [Lentilactobacillus hilgardii]|nr:hypothetical protein [Lentilactobacillus hilgardii]MCV3739906.1 hypothetical protein [Lentilactobacillus hilgardii]